MAKLQDRYKKELCKWIGGRRDFTLLYQATRDGCSAQAFHRKCNNKGPTVTVLYNTDGYVFGGYASQPWVHNMSDPYATDNCAFIFRLASSNSLQPKKCRVKEDHKHHALVNNNSWGPCFGSDMQTFQGTISMSSNYFKANGYYQFGTHYDMQGDDANTFCGNNYMYTDIEVYQVTESTGTCQRQGESPWRSVRQDFKTLMSHVERYSPPESCKVKAINLLLLGPVGAGKSSFFNSVSSVFRREITALARSGSAERSLTTTYRRYRVRSRETGEALKLRLCDTRGLEIEGGLDLIDLMAVVEGHVPDRFQFTPTVQINSKSTGYNSTPSQDDQIHCVAFVIDGTAVDVFPEKITQVLKALQQRLNPLGIPQVVIVTKCDKVCPEVQEDAGQMFNSATIGDLVEQAGQLLGLPGSCVFPVKNYDHEVMVKESVDIPILVCLKQILIYAEDYILDSFSSD